jgi:hypothetical protein
MRCPSVLLTPISNGFYAATSRKSAIGSEGFQPTVAAMTRSLGREAAKTI